MMSLKLRVLRRWIATAAVLTAMLGWPMTPAVHAEGGAPAGYVYVVYGTVHVYSDGSVYVEGSGRIELIPYVQSEQSSTPPQVRQVKVELTQSGSRFAMLDSCTGYTATAPSIPIGSTYYKRVVNYCVNSSMNELVFDIYVKNIGSVNTPILNEESLGWCHTGGETWVAYGPWIITPGATLSLHPWHEIPTSSLDDGQVAEHWSGGPIVYSCLPD